MKAGEDKKLEGNWTPVPLTLDKILSGETICIEIRAERKLEGGQLEWIEIPINSVVDLDGTITINPVSITKQQGWDKLKGVELFKGLEQLAKEQENQIKIKGFTLEEAGKKIKRRLQSFIGNETRIEVNISIIPPAIDGKKVEFVEPTRPPKRAKTRL